MMAQRASTPSQTQTQTTVPIRLRPQQAVLRLQGASTQEEVEEDGKGKRRARIQWAEDVIDNEGLGRKKSKGMFNVIFLMFCHLWAK